MSEEQQKLALEGCAPVLINDNKPVSYNKDKNSQASGQRRKNKEYSDIHNDKKDKKKDSTWDNSPHVKKEMNEPQPFDDITLPQRLFPTVATGE